MSYEDTSKESLKALGSIVRLCVADWPCRQESCKRCRREAARQEALEQADLKEDAIWGSDV